MVYPTQNRPDKPLLYLINPGNFIRELTGKHGLNRYYVWPPLSLILLSGLTPDSWEIRIIDENKEFCDYDKLQRPALVGITAFTCRAARAYEIAFLFRRRKVPVVMGGIHASMCKEEAKQYVDSVAVGEVEEIWKNILDDSLKGELKPYYFGKHTDLNNLPAARHDLLPNNYIVGTVQTRRGCPLGCRFCSVTAYNGRKLRQRPIKHVVDEIQNISNKYIFFADDNLIGISKADMDYTKGLFRAMIKQEVGKFWIAQVTINVADDPELLHLAKQSGCVALYIGFESLNSDNLKDMKKTFNLRFGMDYYQEAIRRIHEAGIGVSGAFIVGFDQDRLGVGDQIVNRLWKMKVDAITIQILTPFPGTEFYKQMEKENRIILNNYPHDWKYYSFNLPTCEFDNFSWPEIMQEIQNIFDGFFKNPLRVLYRCFMTLLNTRDLRVVYVFLLSNFSTRRNWQLYTKEIRKIKGVWDFPMQE